jgi:hypothetical protein
MGYSIDQNISNITSLSTLLVEVNFSFPLISKSDHRVGFTDEIGPVFREHIVETFYQIVNHIQIAGFNEFHKGRGAK